MRFFWFHSIESFPLIKKKKIADTHKPLFSAIEYVSKELFYQKHGQFLIDTISYTLRMLETPLVHLNQLVHDLDQVDTTLNTIDLFERGKVRFIQM
jgi:hypothetical protein